jgi:hypothetical protein
LLLRLTVFIPWLFVLANYIERLKRGLNSFLGWRIVSLQKLLLLLVPLVRRKIGPLRRLLGQVPLLILKLKVQVDLVLLTPVPNRFIIRILVLPVQLPLAGNLGQANAIAVPVAISVQVILRLYIWIMSRLIILVIVVTSAFLVA